ncbi:MAG TPA: RsbRD N-terminal domain-containing protein [Pyrinomonadaceae bacterium]|nr:RsbRD N-terminal domain-containing protein [Pyrinomonadaceae bacterium]
MPERFITLIRRYDGAIISAWMDELYRDQRTELPARLSYGQLVDHLPELLEELAHLLDAGASDVEILEATRRLRTHAQVRFHQGVLMDELARELMFLRRVIEDFLWRESASVVEGDLRELRDALRRANRFMDEMMAQALVIYAASLRPPVETRSSVWPPPRRRKTDFTESDT